jgi:hypothetical protein
MSLKPFTDFLFEIWENTCDMSPMFTSFKKIYGE